MIALDTNILIYAHHARYLEHRRARTVIEEAARDAGGWGLALPCVAEFWAVVTHPASSGRPSRPREARAFLSNLTAAGAKIFSPGPSAAEQIAELATSLDIRGHRIFDLQIAQICREAGVRKLWTHDKNFVAVPGLTISDPL
jgi:toxin-antitoxin system PIN domain toxin